MMTWLRAGGRCPRTVNNYRLDILAVWREAHDSGWIRAEPPSARRLRKLKEPTRVPRAWSIEEMRRIVAACDHVRVRRGWGGPHWKALILAAYETSLRIGALTRVPLECFDHDQALIVTPGEIQKTGVETVHRLHRTRATKRTCRGTISTS